MLDAVLSYPMGIAWVQWINPWWALALPLAVVIPLLAHMRNRDTPRELLLPTVRFAQAAAASYQQWARPRHWIILAGRATILALMVAALAGPRWVTHGTTNDQNGAWNVVLIVDRSASMTRSKHGSTLFEEAKQRAVDVIESLDPSRDRASVILLDANPTLLLPQPTANLPLLINRLTHSQPTFQHGDLPTALQLARLQAKTAAAVSTTSTGHSAGVKRAIKIYLISDMQATQWVGFGREVPLDIPDNLIIHTIAGPGDNVAVSRPVVAPPRPIAGQPATISIDVSRYLANEDDQGRGDDRPDSGYEHHATVKVELQTDGYTQSQSVNLTRHETRIVQFEFIATRSGPAWVEVALTDPQGRRHRDALPCDDQTGLLIHVDSARHVAMVTDHDPNNPTHAAYYTARALAPDARDIPSVEQAIVSKVALTQFNENSRLAVQLATWPTRELASRLTPMTTGLSLRPNAIVIVEAGRLDQPAISALRRYLKSGGVVVWIVDSQPAAVAFAQFLDPLTSHDLSERMSPIELATTVDLPQNWHWHGWSQRSLDWAAFDHPVLKIFEGPARANLLRQRFTATWTWQPGSGFDSLLTFDDGTPALACRWVGAGRLAVFAGDWSPQHSNWVKDPLFVPMVHQLLRELIPSSRGLSIVHPGQHPTINLPLSSESFPPRKAILDDGPNLETDISKLICLGPNGQRVPLAPLRDRSSAIRLSDVSLPGRYTVTTGADQVALGGVYVEINPAESDLRVRDLSLSGEAWGEGMRAQNAVSDHVHLHNEGDLQGDTSNSAIFKPRPVMTPLWPYAVLLAVIMATIEPVVVAWIWDKPRSSHGQGVG